MGSQGELETEVEIALRNHFIPEGTATDLIEIADRVGAMLFRLHNSLDNVSR